MQVITDRKLQVNLPEVLRSLVISPKSPVLSAKEIAGIIDAAPSTVYNSRLETGNFTPDEFMSLVRAYVSRDEFTLINFMLPDGYTIVKTDGAIAPDGRMSDNLQELVESAVAVTTRHDKGDKVGALKGIPRVKLAAFGLEKEARA
jgi:hypothetical protein